MDQDHSSKHGFLSREEGRVDKVWKHLKKLGGSGQVAQLVRTSSPYAKVVGLILSHCMYGRPPIDVSHVSASLSLPLFLSKTNK